MRAFADISFEDIKTAAANFGLTTEELSRIAMHDFGRGKITLTVVPGNPRPAEFVRHLVKEGHAFPDLSQPGRWQMTPDR